MKALRCDRCGEFFSGYGCKPDVFTNPDAYPRTIYVDSTSYNIDLCDTCSVELRDWWNAKGAPIDIKPDAEEVNDDGTN